MALPTQPLPTIGGLSSTEDPKTRAALLELQQIVAALDGSNFPTSFISTFVRTLLDDVDAATARATLGVARASGVAQLNGNGPTTQTADILKVTLSGRSASRPVLCGMSGKAYFHNASGVNQVPLARPYANGSFQSFEAYALAGPNKIIATGTDVRIDTALTWLIPAASLPGTADVDISLRDPGSDIGGLSYWVGDALGFWATEI